MSLVRTLFKPVHSIDYEPIYDCNTGVGGSTAGGTITGNIIDRLALGRHFQVAAPVLHGHGLTSTQANKKVQLDTWLQHGDSSGGGDMAAYSSGFQPATVVFGTTALTTPMAAWSTAEGDYHTGYAAYDLRAAKQFIRQAAMVTMPGNTTSTADGEQVECMGTLVFAGADEDPPLNTSTGVNSTSTST